MCLISVQTSNVTRLKFNLLASVLMGWACLPLSFPYFLILLVRFFFSSLALRNHSPPFEVCRSRMSQGVLEHHTHQSISTSLQCEGSSWSTCHLWHSKQSYVFDSFECFFRRVLRENNLVNWHELVTKVAGVQLVDQPDKVHFFVEKKVESSMYNQYIEKS